MSENPEDLLGFTPVGAGEPEGEFEYDNDELPAKSIPAIRGDRFGVDKMTDPRKLITWMNNTRKLPLEAIDKVMVDQTYAAAVWLFRSAAVAGDLKATKAMEAWLAWAKPIINLPERNKKPKPSTGSVAFLPRNPTAVDEPGENE